MIIWVKIFFVQFLCVSCHRFLISSASVRSLPFLFFIEPIFAWNVPLVSLIFLKRSLIFPILLFSFLCTDHWGRLSYLSLVFFGTVHSNGYIFTFLFCFLFVFLSQLFIRPSQKAILLFFHFFFLGRVLLPVSCTMSWTSVHSSSVILSDLVP